jgi:site-specific DNA recombinase
VRSVDVSIPLLAGGDVDLNNDKARMQFGIIADVTQHEADNMSTRLRRQKQHRREQGLPHGGHRPFGWRNLMEPDPVEAAALQDATEAVVRGATVFDIAAQWEAAGLGRPRRAVPWTGNDVRRVLVAPRHVGLIVHRGEIALDTDGNEIRSAWPAIVSRTLWEACRSVLIARATGIRVARRRSMLTGLLRCGACGANMTRSSIRRRSLWRCWRDKGGCGAVSIGAVPLEIVITETLFDYVDGNELRTALASRDHGRVQAIRADLTAVDVQRRALVEAFAGGGDPKELRMACDALYELRTQLEAELGADSANIPPEGYEAAGALREAWLTLTTDQRRTAIAAAFGEITVERATGLGRRFDPGRVTFGRQR